MVSERLRSSVVKIFTVLRAPNHYQPWELNFQENSGGSGFFIEGGMILTTAHVVADAVFVQVLRSGDSQRLTARVLHVNHDLDLALLIVDGFELISNQVPTPTGELPPLNAQVSILGFSLGGTELSVTPAISSRLEVQTYAHSKRTLLTMLTDKSIDAGVSGGPVFWDDRLVGVAFQVSGSRGHIIPSIWILHFIEDLRDGTVSGVPDLGIVWQKIENPALQNYLMLSAPGTGVLVSDVIHGSSAHSIIQKGDVLTRIDDVEVSSDGSFLLRDQVRIHFSHLVSRKQVGDEQQIRLIRDGKEISCRLKLKTFRSLVPLPNPQRYPSYFILGGLVFVRLTSEYMSIWDWDKISFRYKHLYFDETPGPERDEVVLISQVLAHAVNVGYHKMGGVPVISVNHRRVRNLLDVVVATKTPVNGYHIIEVDNPHPRTSIHETHTEYGNLIVLSARDVEDSADELLNVHSVPKDRSDDLVDGTPDSSGPPG